MDGPSVNIHELLEDMITQRGSDLFLSTAAFIQLRIEGELYPITEKRLVVGQTRQMAEEVLTPEQIEELDKKQELNIGIVEPGVGRFRANFFKQRGEIAIVIRHIKTDIPQPHELGLPDVLKNIVMAKNGLILVVGATGSGKSTTLASLVDYRATHQMNHIITIEDPIEYTYQHSKSVINQREIGMDTQSWENAIENTLRQSPDVVVVGEIRTRKVLENAIALADTGHLAISTLHATNARMAFERILNFYPKDQHQQILFDLSHCIRAILCQRLVPSIDGRRRLVTECLVNTNTISDFIKKGEFALLSEVMEKSEVKGMHSFDQSLLKHYKAGVITENNALLYADSEHDLRLKIQIESGAQAGKKQDLNLAIDGGDSTTSVWKRKTD